MPLVPLKTVGDENAVEHAVASGSGETNEEKHVITV
jgi:hypothetical protein